jgi:hypothetical protein
MVDDSELVQNLLMKNHILASEKMLKETGYEKEWVMEAFHRFELEGEKKVKQFHNFLQMQRTKD